MISVYNEKVAGQDNFEIWTNVYWPDNGCVKSVPDVKGASGKDGRYWRNIKKEDMR